MRGVFDDGNEFQPVKPRRDTELTLGPYLLLVLFFGLVLLCGLCFGVGYSLGGRNVRVSAPAAVQPCAPAPAVDSQSKPAAAPPGVPPAEGAGNGLPPAAASGAVPVPGAENPGSALPAGAQNSAPGYGANPAQWVVKPALPAPAQAPMPGQPAPAGPNPAVPVSTAAAPALMVQIAAVSQVEDARVLVAALRQRGYAVTARRDSADGLIHLRIGPFRSRSAANAMSRKLLNDGYNAVVEP